MAPSFTDAQASHALQEVLSEPPFTGGGLGTGGLWRRLWDILVAWYDEVVVDIYDDSPVAFWTLTVVLLVVLGVLIWHMTISVREVWRSIQRAGDLGEEGEATVAALTLAPARAALAAADCRRAVELAWSTTAQALMARSGPATGLTPRQQARLFRTQLPTPQTRSLDALLGAHEHACYSGGDTDAQLAREAIARAAELLGPRARDGA